MSGSNASSGNAGAGDGGGNGGIGRRNPSLGTTLFGGDPSEEPSFPAVASRVPIAPPSLPSSSASGSAAGGPTGTSASGFLRSMFGLGGGSAGQVGQSGPMGIRPIRTPHEPPSHPELVCSPTDIGVWEFGSRFTPPTPKDKKSPFDKD